MTEISADDLNSLAAKLDALDLSEGEQAALSGLIERAGGYEPGVEGFGFSASKYTGLKSGAGLSGNGLKIAGGLGFIMRPDFGSGVKQEDLKKP